MGYLFFFVNTSPGHFIGDYILLKTDPTQRRVGDKTIPVPS